MLPSALCLYMVTCIKFPAGLYSALKRKDFPPKYSFHQSKKIPINGAPGISVFTGL